MDYETTFKDEITASDATSSNMESYIIYNNSEILPNCIDGLKLCHRRIITVLGSDERRMKGATLTGIVMNKYHPHGDNGIYDAIVRLGQTFSQVHPFVTIMGNYGAYGGGEYGAGRYLDVQYSQFTKDLFFTNVDTRTLTYIPSETGEGVEPAYYIPRLPTTLLMGTFGVSVAYKSVIPQFNFNSLCNLVSKFIELRKQHPTDYKTSYAEIAEYCIPDFPTHVLIRNKAELIREYSKGNFSAPIIMDGIIDISPSEFNLRTVPHGTAFEKVFKKVGEMMNSANFISANFTEINDLTTGTEFGNIQFKIKRGVDPFDVLDGLKKQCTFTQSWTPIWTFIDKNGFICQMNPMELLEVWYLARYRSILGALKFKNIDLFKQFRKLSALIIIADHTDEVLKIFKTSENRDATVPRLCKAFKLTREQAEYIATLQLQQITHQGKAELLKALQETKTKIEELQKKFVNIDQIILDDVEYLRSHYALECPRRSELPNFIGALHLTESKGYIQFSSYQELAHLMKRWSKNQVVDIIMYPNGSRYLLMHTPSGVISDESLDFPKAFKAEYLEAVKLKPRNAIALKNGFLSRIDGLSTLGKKAGKQAHVSMGFTALDNSFVLKQITTSDLVKRRNVDAMGAKSDLMWFNGVQADEVVVAIANDKLPNQLDLVKMKTGDKYHRMLIGHTEVLGMWKFGNQISVRLPEAFISRCGIRHLIVRDPIAMFRNDDRVTVSFTKHRTSNGINLSPLAKGVDILTDKSLKGENK